MGIGGKLVHRLYDRTVRAPAGLGVPIDANAWDSAFAAGRWEYLADLSEMGRYAVIASYVAHIAPRASILDVGCGAGILRSYFDKVEFRRYTGVDISQEAVRQAEKKGFRHTQFVVSNFDSALAIDGFDVIIFNESIGYARDAGITFRRYWDTLKADGHCVISMYDIGMRSRAMWRRISASQKPVHATRVINERRQVWDIRLFSKTV